MDGSPQEVGQTPWAGGLECDLWLGQQELACQVSLKRVKPWPSGAVGSRSPSLLWEDALLPLEAEQGPTSLRSLWDQQCHLGADGGNDKSPPLRGCADSPGTGPPVAGPNLWLELSCVPTVRCGGVHQMEGYWTEILGIL